jgi:hypothetical protein
MEGKGGKVGIFRDFGEADFGAFVRVDGEVPSVKPLLDYVEMILEGVSVFVGPPALGCNGGVVGV